MSRKVALHFGAGNIGRGFIGALLSRAGYHVIFADVAEKLIQALNEYHEYNIHILDIERANEIETVTNVSGVISTNEPEMLKLISEAEIITTAVGAGVLKNVAETLAKGIMARRDSGNSEKFNIIACENLTRASSHLRELIESHLPDQEAKKYLHENVGFPNCSVDRIVPPMEGGENILAVGVENFYEWIVEEPAIRGKTLEIPGMKLTDNLVAYVQRKLFTLNTGHAICAYLGFLKGFPTVSASLRDPWIEDIVRKAMQESGAALCKKYGFNPEEHEKYIEKIMNRFRNPYINDDVVRVGREPLRKLAPGDRLVGPVNMAREFGLNHDHLLMGIAAALMYKHEDDKQSLELHEKLEKQGIGKVIAEVTGFREGSQAHREVVESWNDLKQMKESKA
ncbi:hypothetical protein RUND412_009182 [Rhizina undulata]